MGVDLLVRVCTSWCVESQVELLGELLHILCKNALIAIHTKVEERKFLHNFHSSLTVISDTHHCV